MRVSLDWAPSIAATSGINATTKKIKCDTTGLFTSEKNLKVSFDTTIQKSVINLNLKKNIIYKFYFPTVIRRISFIN